MIALVNLNKKTSQEYNMLKLWNNPRMTGIHGSSKKYSLATTTTKITTTFFQEPETINHELPPKERGDHPKLTINTSTFRLTETSLFKTWLQSFLQKQLSEGTGYKDDSEDRGGKIRKERVVTFKCSAAKRPGVILLESKSITFLPDIRAVTVNACWHSGKWQGMPEEWPSQNV